jgi:hypothetical protein
LEKNNMAANKAAPSAASILEAAFRKHGEKDSGGYLSFHANIFDGIDDPNLLIVKAPNGNMYPQWNTDKGHPASAIRIKEPAKIAAFMEVAPEYLKAATLVKAATPAKTLVEAKKPTAVPKSAKVKTGLF